MGVHDQSWHQETFFGKLIINDIYFQQAYKDSENIWLIVYYPCLLHDSIKTFDKSQMGWILLKVVLSVLFIFKIDDEPMREAALETIVRAHSTHDADELGQLPAGLLDYCHVLQMTIGRTIS